MEIRQANSNDAALLQIATQLIINESTIYNERAKKVERDLYSLDYISHLVGDGRGGCAVAVDGQDVAAFALTRPDNGPWWLSWFGVLPRWRGKGLGNLLVAWVEDSAANNGVHKIWCDTRTSNHRSISILNRRGWQRVARIDNHWCNQDYLLWQKFVAPHERMSHEPDDLSATVI